MRYVIMAVAAVFATVGWLGTPDGQRAKQRIFASGHSAPLYGEAN